MKRQLNDLLEEMDEIANAVAAMKKDGWTVSVDGEGYSVSRPGSAKHTISRDELLTWHKRQGTVEKPKFDMMRK